MDSHTALILTFISQLDTCEVRKCPAATEERLRELSPGDRFDFGWPERNGLEDRGDIIVHSTSYIEELDLWFLNGNTSVIELKQVKRGLFGVCVVLSTKTKHCVMSHVGAFPI